MQNPAVPTTVMGTLARTSPAMVQRWFRHHCCWRHCDGPRGHRQDRGALHVQRALGACVVGADLH
eukprot:5560577-Alexandrium_andersonii.AAC.1